MLWCLIGSAITCVVVALLAMVARPRHLQHMRLGLLVRGCIVLPLLLLGVALGVAALLTTQ